MGRSNMSGPLYVGGIPVGGDGIPTTFGDYFYVDSVNGSNTYDGLTMETAKETVLAGYGLMTTNKHDVLVMSGVDAHAFATQLDIAKNRCHFVGLGGGSRYIGQRCRWEMGVTTGSEIAMVKNTGVGNTFTNIKMRSTDTNTSSLYTFADAGEYTQFNNVSLEKDALLGTAGTAELLCNADSPYYYRSTFGNTIYKVTSTTRGCVSFALGIIGTCRDAMFEDCMFLTLGGATTSCFLYIPGTNDIERFLILKNCIMLNQKLASATMALAIRTGAALGRAQVLLKDCVVMNATDTGTSAHGVYTTSPTPVDDGTEAIQVATT